jgi:hypothetical protein
MHSFFDDEGKLLFGMVFFDPSCDEVGDSIGYLQFFGNLLLQLLIEKFTDDAGIFPRARC